MYVLGLDPSTKSTGYSIFENENLIDHGVITAGSSNVYNRIDKMITELEKILQKYSINHCIIEEVLPEDVRFNNNAFKPLMYLQGFICHLLNKYNINFSFYMANEWRKKCGIQTGPGIKRENLKNEDKLFVKKIYNIDVCDDEADGICLGYSYTHEPIPIEKQKQKVIKTDDGFEFG